MNVEPTIRLARADDESKVARLLDEAFASPERESRLWAVLRTEFPDYDPQLAFVADEISSAGKESHALLGALLVHPRTLWIRGVQVPAAVLSPFAVHPRARGTGFGERLMRHALEACAERFEFVVLLGEPEFFGRYGFSRAFGQSRVRVRLGRDLADLAGDGWRAITGEDLARCRDLYEDAYREVSGTERRTLSALDWDSRAPHTHTLVLPRGKGVAAYARFHIGTSIITSECAASSPGDVEALLGLLARLGVEHGRENAEILIPRSHPLTRSLLRVGGELTTHDMTGAVLGYCPNVPRFLARQLTSPRAAAFDRAADWEAFGLAWSGGGCVIEPSSSGPIVTARGEQRRERKPRCVLRLRDDRLSGWLTGLEPLRDVLDVPAHEDTGEEILANPAFRALDQLLPPVESFWSWSPVYDVVGW